MKPERMLKMTFWICVKKNIELSKEYAKSVEHGYSM